MTLEHFAPTTATTCTATMQNITWFIALIVPRSWTKCGGLNWTTTTRTRITGTNTRHIPFHILVVSLKRISLGKEDLSQINPIIIEKFYGVCHVFHPVFYFCRFVIILHFISKSQITTLSIVLLLKKRFLHISQCCLSFACQIQCPMQCQLMWTIKISSRTYVTKICMLYTQNPIWRNIACYVEKYHCRCIVLFRLFLSQKWSFQLYVIKWWRTMYNQNLCSADGSVLHVFSLLLLYLSTIMKVKLNIKMPFRVIKSMKTTSKETVST